MEYLETLGISDLISYLEIKPKPPHFKKVEKVLLSREKSMTNRVDGLEKNLEVYKAKCSELSVALEEFKGNKVISDELKEKVTCLEEEGKLASEREEPAIEKISELLSNHENVSRERKAELSELQKLIRDLEIGKQDAKDELQAQKLRYAELEKKMKHSKELEKELEECKGKYSDLWVVLEEKNKTIIVLEGKLEDSKAHNMISDKLKEKVARMEEDFKLVSQREMGYNVRITNLLGDVEKLKCDRSTEIDELKTKNKYLECVKQIADDEVEAQKKKYNELEKMMKNSIEMEKDLETSKAKYSELLISWEEKNKRISAIEDELEELKKFKTIYEELLGKVTSLEENCKVFSEREESAKERITKLLASLEQLKDERNKEVGELKAKNKDLECAKRLAEEEIEVQKEKYKELEKFRKHSLELEKDLEISKAKYSEMWFRLEEKNKKSIAVESELEEFKKYKTTCDELKEKVTRLKQDCKAVSKREKNAKKKMNDLVGDIEKLNRDKNEAVNELEKKNRDLECAKQKAESEILVQKKRFEEMETRVTKLENETSALLCQSQVSTKPNTKLGTEISKKKGKKDESKQGKIRSETSGGVNGNCSSKLKIKLRPLSSVSDVKVPEEPVKVSDDQVKVNDELVKINDEPVQVSDEGQVKVLTFKRKRARKILSNDGGDDDDQMPLGKLKKKSEETMALGLHRHSDSAGNQTPVSCGGEHIEQIVSPSSKLHSESAEQCEEKDKMVEGTPSKDTVVIGTSGKESGHPVSENTNEKANAVEKRARRTSHPPNRLNL